MRVRDIPFITLLCIALTGQAARAATTNFFEGFESGLTNWVVGDGNPNDTPAYWGIVNSSFGGEGTHSGSFKAYCAGTGYAGTAASPAYRDSMTAYLARTINLGGYTNATLSFWYKLPGIEGSYDFARVFIGTTELWSKDAAQAAWTNVTLSLESFIGTTQALKFEFKSDASFTLEGAYLDDVLLTDAATPTPPPANDNVAAAQVVTGSIGTAGAMNHGATSEAGEPAPGNSIWFRWTPYTNGFVTFRTGGSAFNTLLCVYRGSALANLAPVACDDNGDTNGGSLVTFNASLGTNYYFSVRGVSNASGFVLLNWLQTNGLGVDLLPDLFVWSNAPNNYLYGWYLDQNEGTAPGRTLLRVSTATPNIGAGALELHGSSTTPGVYQRIFRADGSHWERYAGNFTFHPGHGHLHFDNWINMHLRTVLTNEGVGDLLASGDKTSFAIIDLAQYDGSLPGAPSNSQYGGGLIQGLSVGWADVYGANLQDQWIDVTDVPSGRYWLEAVVDPANSILESNETNNLTRLLITLNQPGGPSSSLNDHFTNAFLLPHVTGGDIGNSTGATREPAEPLHRANTTSSHSLWWRWTAPSNMSVTIGTDGSGFDTVLAVYRGATLATLTKVTDDDDSGPGNLSLLTFNATNGVTYFIAVDGYGNASGSVQLNLNPAINDDFARCLVISGFQGSAGGSTRDATKQGGEPNHAGLNGPGSIWYCWTAPTNALFTFDTIGSGYDTALAIYTGTAVNALTPIASDNDSGSNGASRLGFTAVSNTTYRIAVDGAPGASGVVRLNWSGPAAPAITAQPLSMNIVSGSPASFSVTATGSTPMSWRWRHQGTNLSDGAYLSGANSAVLNFNKVVQSHWGVYTVVLSNAYGSVTSAPANLIVLDNPRMVFTHEIVGHSGAFVRVPVEMQSLGNEHSLTFSLQFDPAVLSHPRAENAPAGAVLLLNTNLLHTGALGVSLTLAGSATFATGHVEVVDFVFDSAPSATHVTSYAGFGTLPFNRAVRDTSGASLSAVFVPGTVDLDPLRVTLATHSNGTTRVNFATGPGARYAVEASANLTAWTILSTNTSAGGTIEVTDPAGLPHRFYRLRLVP